MPNDSKLQPSSDRASGLELKRLIRHPLSYARLALLDLAEELGGYYLRDRINLAGQGSSETELELKVYDRVSQYSFEMRAEKDFCHLEIRFLTAAADLSVEGRKRSLRFLADALEQSIENSLTENYVTADRLTEDGPADQRKTPADAAAE